MKVKIILSLMLFSCISQAQLNSITWKGIYYPGVPIRIGISEDYCKERSPGTFIHTVKDALTHPIVTDKGITLSHAQFNLDEVEGIYLIHGSFLATGKIKDIKWREPIYYFLYKFSEAGETKGVWYTQNCKGVYKGMAMINKK